MPRSHARVAVRFERELTGDEMRQLLEHAPHQLHLAPGQDGKRSYWFEVTASWNDKRSTQGAFYIKADSLAAAKDYAALLGELFRDRVEAELQKLKGRKPPDSLR